MEGLDYCELETMAKGGSNERIIQEKRRSYVNIGPSSTVYAFYTSVHCVIESSYAVRIGNKSRLLCNQSWPLASIYV